MYWTAVPTDLKMVVPDGLVCPYHLPGSAGTQSFVMKKMHTIAKSPDGGFHAPFY